MMSKLAKQKHLTNSSNFELNEHVSSKVEVKKELKNSVKTLINKKISELQQTEQRTIV